jgi:hypothetical protein
MPQELRRSAFPYVLIAVIAALPPVALGLMGVFGDDSVPTGRCEGLGGGCAMSPADTARLFLLFALPVMLLWAAGAMLVLALLRRRPAFRERPAVVQGLLPMVPPLLAIVAVAVLWIRH